MSKSKLREEYEARFGVVKGSLKLYDDKGNQIYFEDSNGWRSKKQYDTHGNQSYYETSDDYWLKSEYTNGKRVYSESSYGVIKDNRSCSDKVFIDEQSGKKFKMTEVK